ncbi:MAG TPA: septation protein SpoVG family protein [Candidatus Saccharimonadales bacterium]|nr:septation protein SpoVG family protein [Candidatus Saccharimonadales bacterium]
MKITEVEVVPIKPTGGLVGFASCIIDDWLYIGSIAIHARLRGGYRLVFPTRRIGDGQIHYFHPITRDVGRVLEDAIITKCVELFDQPS